MNFLNGFTQISVFAIYFLQKDTIIIITAKAKIDIKKFVSVSIEERRSYEQHDSTCLWTESLQQH